MAERGRLLIYADAGPSVGIGHVMRCLAVAQAAVREGLEVAFATTREGSSLVARYGFTSIEHQSGDPPCDSRSAYAIIDGYHYPASLGSGLRAAGTRLARVIDATRGRVDADVVLNQNAFDDVLLDVDPGTTVLLGPRYALVRDDVRLARRGRTGSTERVLLTFGGSDPRGLGASLVHAVASVAPAVAWVVGPTTRMAPGTDLPPNVEVIRNPATMQPVFDTVDAAVAAAGSTTWELLHLGIPSALVETVDNQVGIASGAAALGAAIEFSPARLLADPAGTLGAILSPASRVGLSTEAMAAVPGDGAERLVAALVN